MALALYPLGPNPTPASIAVALTEFNGISPAITTAEVIRAAFKRGVPIREGRVQAQTTTATALANIWFGIVQARR